MYPLAREIYLVISRTITKRRYELVQASMLKGLAEDIIENAKGSRVSVMCEESFPSPAEIKIYLHYYIVSKNTSPNVHDVDFHVESYEQVLDKLKKFKKPYRERINNVRG